MPHIVALFLCPAEPVAPACRMSVEMANRLGKASLLAYLLLEQDESCPKKGK